MSDAVIEAFQLRCKLSRIGFEYRQLAVECGALRDQIVRLRRELDSVRNHVPLQGIVFNGDVL